MEKESRNWNAVTKSPLLISCIVLFILSGNQVVASSELPLPNTKFSTPQDWVQPVGQKAAINDIVPSFSLATITMNQQLLQAALHLSMPEKWTVNQPVLVQLSFQLSPDDLAVEHALTQPYNASEGTVRVAPTLQAQLVSSTLGEIESNTEEIQPLSFSRPTSWEWKIQPNEAGDASLRVLLSLVTEGETVPVKNWEKQISVRKPLGLYLEDLELYLRKNGGWILGVLVFLLVTIQLIKRKLKVKWIETENYSGPDRRKNDFDRRVGTDRRSNHDKEKLIRSRRRGDDRRVGLRDRRVA